MRNRARKRRRGKKKKKRFQQNFLLGKKKKFHPDALSLCYFNLQSNSFLNSLSTLTYTPFCDIHIPTLLFLCISNIHQLPCHLNRKWILFSRNSLKSLVITNHRIFIYSGLPDECRAFPSSWVSRKNRDCGWPQPSGCDTVQLWMFPPGTPPLNTAPNTTYIEPCRQSLDMSSSNTHCYQKLSPFHLLYSPGPQTGCLQSC